MKRVFYVAVLWVACAGVANAETWQRIGPEGGDVISLAAGADGVVYLGTADGHVFVTSDGGRHWELRGRMGKRLDVVVQSLVVDARLSTKLYAAVWTLDPASGGGVFQSEDGGRHWESTGLEGEAVRVLEQSASEPDVLVAGTKSGVFRSGDAGLTWQRISPEGDEELKNLDSIAIDPHEAKTIYAGTYYLPWKTTDGGKSWKAIAEGMIDDSDIMSLEIDRHKPERIFASACSGIYRSENGGAQWTKLQGIPYASRRTQQIAQDPGDAAVWYAGTTEGVWRTRDAGENWVRVTPREWVANAIAFTQGKRLVIGTELQGVLASEDEGKTFSASNVGFSHRVVSALIGEANHKQRLLALMGGAREEILETRDGGKNWTRLPGTLPGGGLARLFGAGDGWFGGLRKGGVARYEETAAKWRELRFATKVTAARSKQSVRAAGKTVERRWLQAPEVFGAELIGGRLFAATAQGIWTGGMREGVLRRIAEKEFPGRVIGLAATTDGTLFAVTNEIVARSADGGKDWEREKVPEEAGELLWIVPEDAGKSQVLLIGTTHGVFVHRWASAGAWKLLQSGLPAARTGQAVLAREYWLIPIEGGGVYVSEDAGLNWERMVGVAEAGRVVGIVVDQDAGVYLGMQTEGVGQFPKRNWRGSQ